MKQAQKPIDFDRFTEFMRQLVAVPRETIKARLEEEKAQKKAAAGSSKHK